MVDFGAAMEWNQQLGGWRAVRYLSCIRTSPRVSKNPLPILIFFARLKKTALQQLPISTSNLSAWKNRPSRMKIYAHLSIGHSGGGKIWERIRSRIGF
jgi:hypothetical protein